MDLLNQWEQKYPDSQWKCQRILTEADTLSKIALAGTKQGAPAADVDAAQKAAQTLADNLDKYFAPENKPENVTDDQWKQAKTGYGAQAWFAQANIAASKKDNATAEADYRKVLQIDPNSATASYSLGRLLYADQKIPLMPEALYEIARSLAVTGPEALPAAQQKQIETFLEKAYTGYHGDTSGLDDVKKAAAQGPLPPDGFAIKSVVDIEKEKEGDAAAFAAQHPDIALWRQIRDALTASDGDTYFQTIKDAEVPPQTADAKFKMFAAKVVSQPSPAELVVTVDPASPVGDATLQFESPLKGTIEQGTEIHFKGVVSSYTKEPYMLTFTGLSKEDVEGLPATAFAGTAPSRKKTVPKKKPF
jgi:tetratricopeptide (TPR) repeat protein